ncbi:MAG: DNA repair protein RadA [Ruminococcus sp.]|nr:DNA repair protein RadA [Ruminococcus sp.]
MAKSKYVYTCNQCGYESSKWNGKCPSCGAWNSFEEELADVAPAGGNASLANVPDLYDSIQELADIGADSDVRYDTGLGELNRVLGGGLVKGSLVLLGGEPGIGKSTLLLQICQFLGEEHSVLYVSGEESARQIKLRANRLGVDTENLYILTANDAEAVASTIAGSNIDIVIIDSIQTMSISRISSSPGSLTQVRECTNLFMRTAKTQEIPVIIVGHINKDGAIAGPKVMEHIVDAVLYFEGERHQSYRLLRAVKNRFGSTNEIGVFEMLDKGLAEVANPSQMLLSGRPLNVSGTCVACVMEGSRPILAEVQALASKTSYAAPRRMATGFDFNRLNIIIAVLEKRLGIFMGSLDVYLNIVGGFRLDEPAADLPVAMALYSGIMDKEINEELVAFGEIGLGGEIRSVPHASQRIREAERMGFKQVIIPKQCMSALDKENYEIELIPVSNLKQAFTKI